MIVKRYSGEDAFETVHFKFDRLVLECRKKHRSRAWPMREVCASWMSKSILASSQRDTSFVIGPQAVPAAQEERLSVGAAEGGAPPLDFRDQQQLHVIAEQKARHPPRFFPAIAVHFSPSFWLRFVGRIYPGMIMNGREEVKSPKIFAQRVICMSGFCTAT